MGPDRDNHERSDLDIDQLFGPEPEPHVKAPKLIFTQPIDRTAQLFADEPVGLDEPVRSSERLALDVAFAEQLTSHRVRAIDPAGQPYRPRWKHREFAGEAILRLFQGAAALVLFIAILVLLLMPNGNRREETQDSAAARQLSVPPQSATPPGAAPGAILSDPSGTFVPPPRTVFPSAPMTPQTSAPSQGRAAPPQLTRPSRPPAASTESAVAISTSTGSRPGPLADPRRPAPPAVDVPGLRTDAAAVFGQPVAPPPAEVPPIVVARERGLIPKEETPANPTPTGTSGNSVADVRGIERDKVRAVLSGYERAYSQLDAAAAARLYPAVDRKALSRAFRTLNSQQILFDDCRIEVAQSTAQATCAGTASWIPKVGGGSRGQARRWQFDLRQVSGDWQIGAVKVQ
jgi:hypothetical protein